MTGPRHRTALDRFLRPGKHSTCGLVLSMSVENDLGLIRRLGPVTRAGLLYYPSNESVSELNIGRLRNIDLMTGRWTNMAQLGFIGLRNIMKKLVLSLRLKMNHARRRK